MTGVMQRPTGTTKTPRKVKKKRTVQEPVKSTATKDALNGSQDEFDGVRAGDEEIALIQNACTTDDNDNFKDFQNISSELITSMIQWLLQCNLSFLTKIIWIATAIAGAMLSYDYILKNLSMGTSQELSFENYTSFNTILKPGNVASDGTSTALPTALEEGLADVFSPVAESDVAIFWHLSRSAGTTMKTIGATCLRLVMVTEVGAHEHESDETLAVVKKEKPMGSFVNVDASNIAGLEKAKRLGLGKSELADMIVASHVHQAAAIFDSHHHGRMFCLLRHPVDRVTSLYYFLFKHDREISLMTLEEYAFSKRAERNQMTRLISGNTWKELTDSDLLLAKEILRRKFLIGFLDKKRDSFYRFEKYFGWNFETVDHRICLERIMNYEWPAKNEHPTGKPEGKTWQKLIEANEYDMELYGYAETIFKEQGKLFF